MQFIGVVRGPCSHLPRMRHEISRNSEYTMLTNWKKMIAYYKEQHKTITFRHPSVNNRTTTVFCDASHGGKEETHPHIGYITFNLFRQFSTSYILRLTQSEKSCSKNSCSRITSCSKRVWLCILHAHCKSLSKMAHDVNRRLGVASRNHEPNTWLAWKACKHGYMHSERVFRNQELAKVLWIS